MKEHLVGAEPLSDGVKEAGDLTLHVIDVLELVRPVSYIYS
jgi:hypothetical protein